jgi:hypothetical protein
LVFSWGPLCSAAESSRFEVSITIDMHAFVQRTPLKDVIQDGLKALLLIFYLVGRNPLLNWLSGGINRCWLVKRDWMILKNLLRSPKKSSPNKAGKHQPVAVWAHQVKYCPSRQQIPMRELRVNPAEGELSRSRNRSPSLSSQGLVTWRDHAFAGLIRWLWSNHRTPLPKHFKTLQVLLFQLTQVMWQVLQDLLCIRQQFGSWYRAALWFVPWEWDEGLPHRPVAGVLLVMRICRWACLCIKVLSTCQPSTVEVCLKCA